MKYLVWLVIVVVLIWWIRQQRRPPPPSSKPATKPTTKPQIMVSCTHCGTHVPQDDAIGGQQGLYCSESHRHRHEG